MNAVLRSKHNICAYSNNVSELVKAYLTDISTKLIFPVDKNIREIINSLEIKLICRNTRKKITSASFDRKKNNQLLFMAKFKTFAFTSTINLDSELCILEPTFVCGWYKNHIMERPDEIAIHYAGSNYYQESCETFEKLLHYDSILQPSYVQTINQHVRNMIANIHNDDMGDYEVIVTNLYEQITTTDCIYNDFFDRLTLETIDEYLETIYDCTIDRDTFDDIDDEIGKEFENKKTLENFIKLLLLNVCFCVNHIYHPLND